MNLYQIDSMLESVIDSADSDGVIDETCFDLLTLAKAAKQEGIIKYIKHLDNDNDLISQEIERLHSMKKATLKRQEWLTEYLSRSMQLDGVNELNFVTHKAKFKLNPPSVIIDDESKLKAYVVTKTTESIDKTALKASLMVGVVDGAHLEQKLRLSIN